jgi:putative phosphoserine phosphatase/1-acylglycerol-3-phosphate O-acyltransferase
MDLRERVEQVRSGPSGPRVGAFFDLDGTLVTGFTANAFFTDRVRHTDVSMRQAARTVAAAIDGAYLGGDPTRGALRGFAAMEGQSEETMADLGERLFVQKIAGTIRSEARDLVRAHQQMGHTVAVASAASEYQITPVARDLGIEHVVCTRLEVVEGLLTGRVVGKMVWGDQKAASVRAFARTRGLDLAASYAYGNGAEDVAFLGTVGLPAAVEPHPGLRDAAAKFGWPVLHLQDPLSSDPVSALRTAAALAALNAGVTAGLALGVVTRNRGLGARTGIALASAGALRLAGVSIRTVGAKRLVAHRPAIFVANHQSALDPVVAGMLLRGDFTVIAKKEARADPRAVVGSLLLDPAWVDRGDSAQARAALDEVVARIKGGTSVLIFPEGTRSPTPTLGPFRKGAFHMAVSAGVPVVPIVLRNTGELMRPHARTIKSGTVDVCVLDAVTGWSEERLGEQVETLRQRFVDTLASWPTEGGAR